MPTSTRIHSIRFQRAGCGLSATAIWGALLALLLISGCVRTLPPVQEMSDARQAVAAAREAGADRLASQDFDRAVALLASAESTLERRRFRQARDQALASRRLAIEALEQAQMKALTDPP